MMARGRRGGLAGLLASVLAWWALAGPAMAQPGPACSTCATGGCATGNCLTGFFCQSHHCPPPLKHCTEGPPKICYQHGCPRPICNPCALPNFGYFQTCWTPWPADANWSHCSVPPPAAYVQLGHPAHIPGTPALAAPQATVPGARMPAPRTPPTTAVPPSQPQPMPNVAPRPMGPGTFDVQPLPLPKGNYRPGL
jgi:hypothetical protein